MTESNDDFRTPGQLIEALLAKRGWSKRTLAIVLGVDESGLNKVMAAKRAVDAELALALGEIFDVEPSAFLNLQQKYDLAAASIIARPDPKRARRARLFGDLPISDMIKRGWLRASDVRDVEAVEAELTLFFGAKTPDDIFPHAAKKTDAGAEVTPTQRAWLTRVETIAREMLVPKFGPDRLAAALPSLRALLGSPEETRKVPRILAESGVRFLLVESLPSAKIDGVCFWQKETPVIALSMRFDRIDNFWFVLRHEIEHVMQGHGKLAPKLDVDLDGTTSVDEEEAVANAAAAEFCIPKQRLESFIARKEPFFAERDVLGFANTLQIHPGLVAGQLQHRTKRYDRFRKFQVKVREHIAPSSMVDGWGDVAPVDFRGVDV